MGQRSRQVKEWRSGWTSLGAYVAFSSDGKRLFSGTGNLAAVGEWEQLSGSAGAAPAGDRLYGYASNLIDLSVAPDGRQVAWATHAGLAFVRPLGEENATRAFSMLYEHTLNATFAPDGNSLFTGQYSYAPEIPVGQSGEIVRQWGAVGKLSWL